jgi:hypothetical protein
VTERDFWSLVDSGPSTTLDERLAFVQARLEQMPVEDVAAFEAIRRQLMARAHQRPLWAAAYLMCGGCFDDGFECFKGWLILHGEAVFSAALSRPDSLAAVRWLDWPACEEFLNLCWRVLKVRGEQLPPRPRVERPALGPAWDFDDEGEMERRLPELWKRCQTDPLAG